jgi:Sulfotransferase domain
MSPIEHNITIPSYTDHNGFRMPKGFPAENFNAALRYQAQANDLFVATYPKCGTTWVQHLVYLILNMGNPITADEKLETVFPHLEEVGDTYCKNLDPFNGEYRLLKTHLPYNLTPQNPASRYIFIARNPKDCVVSFFHHTKGFVKHYNFSEGKFEDFFQLFLEGKVDFGDYYTTTRSWFDHRHDNNVLFMTYEDLRRNTKEGIWKIATFLGPKYESSLSKDDDKDGILNQILLHSSLEKMSENQTRFCSERPKEHAPFIRKGSVGGWDEILKPDQEELLNERMRETFSEQERALLGEMYL